MKPIKFSAILPPVQAAIKLDGQGGARIQLDIPEEDRMQVYQLNELKGMVFEVTVSLPQKNKGSR
ncbi:MAG: hypothetical protein M0R06_25135 [Sphaerochaeta sp.]|nr:hypothetical protein [Sphaerochaeta sp.]